MRRVVRYEPAGRAIDAPVTKLGGEPAWLQEPQWPLSRSRNRPMPFIGQFRLDDGTGETRLAYVFMSDLFIFDMEDEEDTGDDLDDENDEAIDDIFVSPDGAEGRFLWQCH